MNGLEIIFLLFILLNTGIFALNLHKILCCKKRTVCKISDVKEDGIWSDGFHFENQKFTVTFRAFNGKEYRNYCFKDGGFPEVYYVYYNPRNPKEAFCNRKNVIAGLILSVLFAAGGGMALYFV